MDFVDLIVGSEGIFGLAVSARLRLAAKPDDELGLFFAGRGRRYKAFESFERAV